MNYYKGIFKDMDGWLKKRADEARNKMQAALAEGDLKEASKQESRFIGYDSDWSDYGDRPRILG